MTNRYLVLVLLLLVYILSFIDRNIMAVLVGPIKEDFGITDAQYGLLHGMAFTMLYVILGVPIAWLADRKNRKNIIAAGTGFWSVMTFLCGLSSGFYSLFFARMGVGVGEAALSPPAHSLLSDYFDKKSLPAIMAIFTLGIPIGVGVSYSLGGWVYGLFDGAETVLLPVLGELRPWQATFMIVGAPGLLVAYLIFRIVEPQRKGVIEISGQEALSLGQILDFVWQYKRVYLSVYFSIACLAIMGYGFMMWFLEHMSRAYQVNVPDISSKFGFYYLVFGVAGTLFGAWLSHFLVSRNHQDAGIRVIMIVAALWLVPSILAPMASSLDTAFLWAIPCMFFLNAYFGVAIAALQLCTPNQLRAQISSLLLLVANVFGLALGPPLIGLFSDYIFSGSWSLGYALSTVGAIFCPLAIVLILLALKPYQRLLQLAEQNWQTTGAAQSE